MGKLPLIITVPHGGRKIPGEIKEIVNIGDEEIFFDGDPCTRDIYDFRDSVECFLDTDIARAAVDLNRSISQLPPKDTDGVIKFITIWQKEIYKKGMFPGEELRKELLDKYYRPFYAGIEKALESGRVKCGLDCHSMSASAPPISDRPGEARPMICLSDNNGKTCPPGYISGLAEEFSKEFGDEGDIQFNDPFFGGNIVKYNYEKFKIPWIQVEISREMYLRRPYLNRQTLEVDRERIKELNLKILRVFTAFSGKI